MKNIRMKALKGCPYHLEGTEFMANSRDAKALVALGKAEIIHADQTYQTRDMGSAPLNRELQAAGSSEEVPPTLTTADAESPVADLEPATHQAAVTEPEAEVQDPADLFASDEARKLAAEHNIDPLTITGTAKDGRIRKSDVQALLTP